MEINRVLVDLSAISHNVAQIRRRIGPDCLLMAVVKSDGYGHGAIEIARTSLQGGANWLGVSYPREGELLRQAGFKAPILIFGSILSAEAERVVQNDLRQTVTDLKILKALDSAANLYKKKASVHLKIDTGMGRIGLRPEDAVSFLLEAKGFPNIELEGIYTHLSSADDPEANYTIRQLEVFEALLAAIRKKGLYVPIKHCANSAATLNFPQAYYDLVRPGIMLYGLYPEDRGALTIDVRPAMTMLSKISALKTVPAGTSIGYLRTFVTRKMTRVATVPLGYGDGYSRLFSNRGQVEIRAKRAQIIGNVCMNAFMIDVSEIDDAEVWDDVLLFGGGLSVHEVARTKGTIVQEIVSVLGRINPRYYLS